MAELAPGTGFFDYTIERLVGRGGFGAVYVARDRRLERRVALKILEPRLAEDPAARRRFIDESRLAASLDHPDIIPIYEAGEEDEQLFLAMRYVPGPDLAGVLERDGPLEPIRAGRIIGQIASALDAAHAAGLVHRDVKPGNVLLAQGTDGADHAYLTDFGLSKRVGGAGAVSQTQAGRFVGTVGYVAPEQVKGRTVDHRADVYSLACLAYHVLTGHQPFERDSEIGTIVAHTEEPPPSVHEALPDVADRVDPAITKGMAKDPADRYASAGAFATDLAAALSSRQPGATVTRGFLFADLRGYTAFIEAHGDEAAVRLLDAFRRMVRLVVARYEGAEIKTEGDSFYVVFPSASSAVQAGLGIIEAARVETEQRPELPIDVGVGVHAGESSEWVEGYVGSSVNIAARLCAQAETGEVLVSDTVRTLIRTSTDLGFDDRGRRTLKGIDEPMAVWAAHPSTQNGPAHRSTHPRRRRAIFTAVAILGVFIIGLALVASLLGTRDTSEPPVVTATDRAPDPVAERTADSDIRAGTASPSPAVAADDAVDPPQAQYRDGRLAYTPSDGEDGIHFADPDGSGVAQLLTGDNVCCLAWSPDGQRIAYNANGTLWITEPAGAVNEKLLDGWFLPTSWSQDAGLLYGTGDGLEVVDVDTGERRQLETGAPDTVCEYDPSLSPDGKRMVWHRSRDRRDDPDGDCSLGQLMIGGADGSDAHPLFGNADFGSRQPAWSPDGSTIAFVRSVQADPRLSVVETVALTDPSGNTLRVLAEVDEIQGLSWSPDGSRVAVASGDYRLRIVDVDTRQVDVLDDRQVGREIGGVAWGPSGSGGPNSMTPMATAAPEVTEPIGTANLASRLDGVIAGDDMRSQARLLLVNADGGSSRRLNLREISRDCCFDPELSPDGEWLVLPDESLYSFRPAGLWKVRVDGSDATKLVGPSRNGRSGPIGSGAWSPDGESIAFTFARQRGDGTEESIATVSADGGDVTEWTDGATTRSVDPTWSPDGTRIAFTRGEELDGGVRASSIWEVDLTTGQERELVKLADRDARHPTWSAAGSGLAFSAIEPGGTGSDIYVASDDGRTIRQLTSDRRSEYPMWSPDGRYIAFRSFGSETWIMSADGAEPFILKTDGEATFLPASWGPEPLVPSAPDPSASRAPLVERILYSRTVNENIGSTDAWLDRWGILSACAYSSSKDAKLYVHDPDSDGAMPYRLTDRTDLNEVGPSWSADASIISIGTFGEFSGPSISFVDPIDGALRLHERLLTPTFDAVPALPLDLSGETDDWGETPGRIALSPDGTSVVWLAFPGRVFISQVGGSGPVELEVAGQAGTPKSGSPIAVTFLPDGRILLLRAVSSGDDRPILEVMAPDGSDRVALGTDLSGLRIDSVVPSPDGRFVALRALEGVQPEDLAVVGWYLADLADDDGPLKRLDIGPAIAVGWSSNDERLLYVPADAPGTLIERHLDGGAERTVLVDDGFVICDPVARHIATDAIVGPRVPLPDGQTAFERGILEPGTHRIDRFHPPMELMVGDGWLATRNDPDLWAIQRVGGGQQFELIASLVRVGFMDSCGAGDAVAIGRGYEGLEEWLGSRADLELSAPAPVNIGGHPGISIRITPVVGTHCTEPPFDDEHGHQQWLVFPSGEGIDVLENGEVMDITAVDVDGTTVSFIVSGPDGPQRDTFMEQLEPVIESFGFSG